MGPRPPARARMGQPGARRDRGRPPEQAPGICVNAAATAPAHGSGHTLALAVSVSQGSQGPETAEPERESEPKSEWEPWAAKQAAPGRRGAPEASKPGAKVGSLRELRRGCVSCPGEGARGGGVVREGVLEKGSSDSERKARGIPGRAPDVCRDIREPSERGR